MNVTTSNSSLVTPPKRIRAQQSIYQVTPSKGNRKVSHSQENTTPSAPQRLTTSSSPSATSGDMSSQSSASMITQKFRN